MAYLAKEMTALQATEIRLGFVFRKNAEQRGGRSECDCGGGGGKSHH